MGTCMAVPRAAVAGPVASLLAANKLVAPNGIASASERVPTRSRDDVVMMTSLRRCFFLLGSQTIEGASSSIRLGPIATGMERKTSLEPDSATLAPTAAGATIDLTRLGFG